MVEQTVSIEKIKNGFIVHSSYYDEQVFYETIDEAIGAGGKMFADWVAEEKIKGKGRK